MKHKTRDIEGSRLAPPNLTQQYRYEWLKRMWAEPKSVLTSDTKLVLGVIWEAVDKDTQSVVRHYDTLAKASGLTAEGVRGCCSRAVAAGYLRRDGKGGVVYDDEGNRRGIPSRFTLLDIHGLASTGKGASRVEEGSKPGCESEQAVLKPLARRAGQRDNSPSLPLSSPCMSLEGGVSLPVASFQERAMWPNWPTEAGPINTFQEGALINVDRAEFIIQSAALGVLGWRPSLPREGWDVVNEHISNLDKHVMAAMVRKFIEGELTTIDIANVLAVAGIYPPSEDAAYVEKQAVGK